MKNKAILLCILLAGILISCQKEELSGPMNTQVMVLKSVFQDDQAYYQYSYNDSGLVSEESGKFDFTQLHYNTRNQLISSDYYWNNSVLNSDIKAIATTLSQSPFVTASNGTKGATIKYEYDGNDELTKVTYSRVASSATEYALFSYDQNSRIDKQILYWNNSETGHIDYFYDGNGNLVKENLYDVSAAGVAELSTTTEYAFDNKRNPYKALKTMMMPGIYTNNSNIVKEVYTVHEDPALGADKVEVTVYAYDYNINGYPVTKNGNIRFEYE